MSPTSLPPFPKLCWTLRHCAEIRLCAHRSTHRLLTASIRFPGTSADGRFAMTHLDAAGTLHEGPVYRGGWASGQAKGRGNVWSVNADRCNRPLLPNSM